MNIPKKKTNSHFVHLANESNPQARHSEHDESQVMYKNDNQNMKQANQSSKDNRRMQRIPASNQQDPPSSNSHERREMQSQSSSQEGESGEFIVEPQDKQFSGRQLHHSSSYSDQLINNNSSKSSSSNRMSKQRQDTKSSRAKADVSYEASSSDQSKKKSMNNNSANQSYQHQDSLSNQGNDRNRRNVVVDDDEEASINQCYTENQIEMKESVIESEKKQALQIKKIQSEMSKDQFGSKKKKTKEQKLIFQSATDAKSLLSVQKVREESESNFDNQTPKKREQAVSGNAKRIHEKMLMTPTKPQNSKTHKFQKSQRFSKVTDQTEMQDMKVNISRRGYNVTPQQFQEVSGDPILDQNLKNKLKKGKNNQNIKELESCDKMSKVSRGSKMSTQSKLSFHSSVQRFRFNNNLMNQMNKSEQIEYYKMQGLNQQQSVQHKQEEGLNDHDKQKKGQVISFQHKANTIHSETRDSQIQNSLIQRKEQVSKFNVYGGERNGGKNNEKAHYYEDNKQNDLKLFKDRKDVIGELILDENAFFGESDGQNLKFMIIDDNQRESHQYEIANGETESDERDTENGKRGKRIFDLSDVLKCDQTLLSVDKSYFKFGEFLQDLNDQNQVSNNQIRVKADSMDKLEQIESKIFFANCNNRFQYYHRVFTHHSVNKYLIVKNLKQFKIEKDNDHENIVGLGQILQGMTLNNEFLTQGQQDHSNANNNNSFLNKLQLSMAFCGANNQNAQDQNGNNAAQTNGETKDVRSSAFLNLPIYKLARSNNNSLIQKDVNTLHGNIVITDQNEQTHYNAQVVPVITDNDNIQLKDYIPKIGSEAILSDNSSDYEDDFSLAPSIILDDDGEQNSLNQKHFNEMESFGQLGTFTKSSEQHSPMVEEEQIDDIIRQDTPEEELALGKDMCQQIEVTIKKMKQSARLIKFSTAEIPNLHEMPQGELSNIVYQEIKRATPFSKIVLPDRHLILPQIYIRHPLIIKGSSGTILEIVNGNFICDFRQFINKYFNGVSPKHHRDFRCLLQEVNIVFKFDPVRIFERLKESCQKLNFDREKVSYSEVCLQYFRVNRNVMQLPMIVVENCTALDVNDCYFRSIKREQNKNEAQSFNAQQKRLNMLNANKSLQDDKAANGNSIFGQNMLNNLDSKGYEVGKEYAIGGGQTSQQFAQQNQVMQSQARDFGIEEIGFWVNGDYMFNHQLNTSEMINFENNEADLRISSSIFYNFYDQIRAGLNTKILIEKCHFSECRNNAIYLINPCSAMLRNNSITRAGHNGILCEWLTSSNWVEKTRKLQVINNEIQMSNENGIFICSQDEKFSAHNLKILIAENVIKKNGMVGLRVSNLIINDLQITTNDFYKNEYGAVKLTQVHQKSNKPKFVMQECNLTDTTYSSGLILKDVGILIQGCRIERNSEDGINIDSSFYPKPAKLLQQEVKQFLKREPMQVIINECEVSYNSKNGIYIQDFWKGPVEIRDCMIVSNQEYGLYLSNKNRPVLQDDDLQFLNQLHQKPSKNKKLPTAFNAKKKIVPFGASQSQQSLHPSPTFELRNSEPDNEYGLTAHHGTPSIRKQTTEHTDDSKIILGQIYIQNTIVYGHSLGGMYVYNTVTVIDFESVFIQRNHEYAIYVPESDMRSLVHLFVRSMHDSVHGAGTGKTMAKEMSLIRGKRQVGRPSDRDDSSDRLLGYFQKFLNSFEEVNTDHKVLGKMGGPWGRITALMPEESLLQQFKRNTSSLKSTLCMQKKEKERSRSNQSQQNSMQNACCLPFKFCQRT